MKKTLLLTLILATVASYAFAQTGTSGVTFSVTPTSQGPVASNSSFNVSLSFSGTAPPSAVDGFDLWIVTSSANSGLFTIASATYPAQFGDPNTSQFFNDPIDDATDSGFVVNTKDLGHLVDTTGISGPPQSDPTAPYTNVPLILTLTINTGVLAPNTTYNFFTSTSATATSTAGGFNRYSDVLDATTGTWTVPAAQFSIFTAVPEPATLSLVGLGGLGALGMTILRRRRR